ncbi:hypothetical protein RDI58_022282 [Solanum bulbocastanum]|uniref:Uncharacterized protein n=1 Tax=Solanum bulbocastanum TaxID=147425 RepID=A0AAN8T914_SOLBU
MLRYIANFSSLACGFDRRINVLLIGRISERELDLAEKICSFMHETYRNLTRIAPDTDDKSDMKQKMEIMFLSVIMIENDGATAEPIGPSVTGGSLRVIFLKELYNGQCYGPLIIGSKSFELVEIHLERLQLNDTGLTAISKCSIFEILHLVETPKCTNNGLNTVAENCKHLRKLHFDGWKTNIICDDGLIAVAKHCPNITDLKPIFSYQDIPN